MNVLNDIAIPSLILLSIGLILGLALGIADKFFKVAVDTRVETIINLLPGINCGACGYPGCAGLAHAIIESKGRLKDCPPLKSDGENAIRAFLSTAQGPHGETLDVNKI
ncbi:MAG: hypothetical protein FWE05_06520 [Defluviitaleaceae bacterium]|nr:hypothetical protein [Defluviitaleaceae bacterium]